MGKPEELETLTKVISEFAHPRVLSVLVYFYWLSSSDLPKWDLEPPRRGQIIVSRASFLFCFFDFSWIGHITGNVEFSLSLARDIVRHAIHPLQSDLLLCGSQ